MEDHRYDIQLLIEGWDMDIAAIDEYFKSGASATSRAYLSRSFSGAVAFTCASPVRRPSPPTTRR